MQTEVQMPLEAPPAAPPSSPMKRAPHPLRRRYWVDWRTQLPITALAMTATLFSLIMFNFTLHDLSASRRESIVEAVPELAERLQHDDRAFHNNIALLSGIFFACTTFGIVVLTNRSVGPIRRIQNQLLLAAQGDVEQDVVIRRRDHFRALAESCNTLLGALRQQRRHDAVQLEHLAEIAMTAEARALAASLRTLAQEKRAGTTA
jgi:methyl-accepting chemotaxis protein